MFKHTYHKTSIFCFYELWRKFCGAKLCIFLHNLFSLDSWRFDYKLGMKIKHEPYSKSLSWRSTRPIHKEARYARQKTPCQVPIPVWCAVRVLVCVTGPVRVLVSAFFGPCFRLFFTDWSGPCFRKAGPVRVLVIPICVRRIRILLDSSYQTHIVWPEVHKSCQS